MIEFEYNHFIYYANVIEYKHQSPVFHISILSNRKDIPLKLVMIQLPDGLELSAYSLPANADLVRAIGEKIMQHSKTEVA